MHEGYLNRAGKLYEAAVGACGPRTVEGQKRYIDRFEAYLTGYAVVLAESSQDDGDNDFEKINRQFKGIFDCAKAESKFSSQEWDRIAWEPTMRISVDRWVRTVMSFNDDHHNEIDQEFFPVDLILHFLNDVKEQSQRSGRRLDLVDQYNIALKLTGNNLISAALLAHAAYRSAGRVLDTRVSGKLCFPVESSEGSISMMNIAKSTAHFNIGDAICADPLGDTYHFWAQFGTGLILELYGDRPIRAIQAKVVKAIFRIGPDLMSFGRETISGHKMIAGNHKQVDLYGLQLGSEMGMSISQ